MRPRQYGLLVLLLRTPRPACCSQSWLPTSYPRYFLVYSEALFPPPEMPRSPRDMYAKTNPVSEAEIKCCLF